MLDSLSKVYHFNFAKDQLIYWSLVAILLVVFIIFILQRGHAYG